MREVSQKCDKHEKKRLEGKEGSNCNNIPLEGLDFRFQRDLFLSNIDALCED